MRRSLRYAGVGAIVTLWTTLLAATAVSGFDVMGRYPLSYLGAQSPSAALFTVGLVVAALLLIAFHYHVRGRYPVGPGFSVAMLAGLAGQVVAAFASIGGSPAVHRIHTTSALVLGVSLPLLMWRFAAAQPSGGWRRVTYRWCWAEAGACLMGLYLSSRMIAPFAEIVPALAFHAWIIAVTFGPDDLPSERRCRRIEPIPLPSYFADEEFVSSHHSPGVDVSAARGGDKVQSCFIECEERHQTMGTSRLCVAAFERSLSPRRRAESSPTVLFPRARPPTIAPTRTISRKRTSLPQLAFNPSGR